LEAMSFWKTPRIGCKCGTSSAADLRRNACSAVQARLHTHAGEHARMQASTHACRRARTHAGEHACSAGEHACSAGEHARIGATYARALQCATQRRVRRVDRPPTGLFCSFVPLFRSALSFDAVDTRDGPHLRWDCLATRANREPADGRPMDGPCLQQPHERRYVPRPLPQRRRDERLQTNKQTNKRPSARTEPTPRRQRSFRRSRPPLRCQRCGKSRCRCGMG
jgi:hypothetical protein